MILDSGLLFLTTLYI